MSLIDIYINSGTENALHLNESYLENLEISDSYESSYKSAVFRIMVSGTTINELTEVNNPVVIYIQDSMEFAGYISRKQLELFGSPILRIQCIGKTYDLWRFILPQNCTYSQVYSGYLVSSLVATYASGSGYYVEPPDVEPDTGSFIEYIDLSNMMLGDAISRISKFDGYHFYVDENGKLQYYKVSDAVQFTVNEEDILKMSPLEHADDNIKNYVVVIGSQNFEAVIPEAFAPSSAGFITLDSPGKYAAQAFATPPSLYRNVLTAVRGRYTHSDSPAYLMVAEVYSGSAHPEEKITEQQFMWYAEDIPISEEGTISSWAQPASSIALDEGVQYWLVFRVPDADSDKWWKVGYINSVNYTDDLSSEPDIDKDWSIDGVSYGDVFWSSNSIRFSAYIRGYPSANQFVYPSSVRTSTFDVKEPFFTDEVEAVFNVSIYDYSTTTDMGQYRRTDDDRYRPRLSIAVMESSRDVTPMFGIEFDL